MAPTGRAPRLRFAANLKWLFTELPFEKRFDAAAAAGFAAVEVTAPYGHAIGELRRWLGNAGVRMVLANTPGGEDGSNTFYGLACHPESVAEFRAGIPLAIEYAVALDVPAVHMMAGVVPDGVPYDVGYATYLENLVWAAEQAAETDIMLVVEVLNQRNVPGFVLRSERQAVEAIDATGLAGIRLLFDVYHVQVNEGDVTTLWRELSPLVGHVQIGDPPGRHEPGTGELRWDFLFDEIAASGFDGWIGCEYRPSTTDTSLSLGWYRRFAPARDTSERPPFPSGDALQ
jgi:hydroxypyruvate isomerase